MAKVRYIDAEPAVVPELGARLLMPDDIVEVPDDRFDAYMLHPQRWESIEEPADRPEPEDDQEQAEPPAPPAPPAAPKAAAPRKRAKPAATADQPPATTTAAAETTTGDES